MKVNMWLDAVNFALTIVLAVIVLWAFKLIRTTNDSTLESLCATGPSLSLGKGQITNLLEGLGAKIAYTGIIGVVGDVPSTDVTVTAQLNCDQ